jgi:hypothetical protein
MSLRRNGNRRGQIISRFGCCLRQGKPWRMAVLVKSGATEAKSNIVIDAAMVA